MMSLLLYITSLLTYKKIFCMLLSHQHHRHHNYYENMKLKNLAFEYRVRIEMIWKKWKEINNNNEISSF